MTMEQAQQYHDAEYYLSHVVKDTFDPISIFLLQFISNYLDRYNAMEWNLTYVAITTTVVLGMIRIVFQKYYGIDWYAFLHAILSSTGSAKKWSCRMLNSDCCWMGKDIASACCNSLA